MKLRTLITLLSIVTLVSCKKDVSQEVPTGSQKPLLQLLQTGRWKMDKLVQVVLEGDSIIAMQSTSTTAELSFQSNFQVITYLFDEAVDTGNYTYEETHMHLDSLRYEILNFDASSLYLKNSEFFTRPDDSVILESVSEIYLKK
jgi:hypothetical protein